VILFLLLVLLGATAVFLFVCLHLRPLNSAELATLAAKRRTKAIGSYYSFSHGHVSPSLEFKKRMAATGKFYTMKEPLNVFPSLAAALLKFKKHEWVIIAFERDQVVSRIWTNRGDDNTQVVFGLGIDQISSTARNLEYSSILVFHNHPNSDPSRYSTRNPSQVDKEQSLERGSRLMDSGVSLVEFVCERGSHHEYRRCISNRLLPLSDFADTLSKSNGQSRGTNLGLHWERLFS